MGNIKYFKYLPKEDQLKSLEDLERGLPLYGLSEDDDTHVKFATMMVIAQIKMLKSDEYNITSLIEVGYDEKGLFVAYPYNADLDSTSVQ